MKKLIGFLFILLLFISCRTVEYKYVPVHEIRHEKVIVRDTIIQIRLIQYRDSVSVKDTINYLENKYAYSNAEYTLGRLNHTLGMKDVKIPVEIRYNEKIIIDSIPYPEEITKTIEIDKRGFFWWSGIALYFLLFGLLVFILVKIFI